MKCTRLCKRIQLVWIASFFNALAITNLPCGTDAFSITDVQSSIGGGRSSSRSCGRGIKKSNPYLMCLNGGVSATTVNMNTSALYSPSRRVGNFKLLAGMRNDNDDNNEESTATTQSQVQQPKRFTSSTVPFSSFLLAFISVRSLNQLFLPSEIPGVLFAGGNVASIDFIGTALDAFFVSYGVNSILQQFRSSSSSLSVPSLAGLECRLTLDIGREQGTWMDKKWAASGGRLVLPINLRFTGEENDLGFPGEESLGGRFCYRIDVLDDDGMVTFIGPQGQVSVKVDGGCWATLPIENANSNGSGGEAKIRFFLDFPEDVSRNDVSLPAGRVFFSGVCFQNADAASLEVGESIVTGPGNVGLLGNGGMTIKKNNILNLYGALGDTNLILGRYKVDNMKSA